MDKTNDSYEIIEAATCLLLSVANADEILEEDELSTIHDIVSDYFKLDADTIAVLMHSAKKIMFQSTGLFEFGQILNTHMQYQDKVDFICCIFEVAFADGDLHYLEHHTIRKIAHIMNIEHEDLVNAKTEIESYL